MDQTAPGPAHDGGSWETAFTDLQGALSNLDLEPGDQIWVATGTYIPTNPADPDDRTATYNLVDGVALYGGFLGNAPGGGETLLSQRDPVANMTALAGGVDTAAPYRRYHVLTATDVSPPTRVDGFLIRDGRANLEEGGPNAGIGGGLLARNANPLVIRCTFWHNKADLFGGGIYFDPPAGDPIFEIINCSFIDNLGDDDRSGGAIYNQGGRLGLTNCVLTGNKVVEDGGAIYNNDGTATFINCTFAGNFVLTGEGGGIFSTSGANAILTNCILWENTAPGPAGPSFAASGHKLKALAVDCATPPWRQAGSSLEQEPKEGQMGNRSSNLPLP